MEVRNMLLDKLNEPFLEDQFQTWGETEQAERAQQLQMKMPGGGDEIDLRNPEDRGRG
jgi:hypothetical protein